MAKKIFYRPKRALLGSSLRNFVNTQPNSKNSTDLERSRRDLSRCKVAKKGVFHPFLTFCWLEMPGSKSRPDLHSRAKTQKKLNFHFLLQKKVRM